MVTDTAAHRWLVADWTELINVLTTLGIHLSLDTLPMESWIRYETRLRSCADHFSTAQKLDYLRAQVFEVYLAEHGASAICAAVLRGLLDSDFLESSPIRKASASVPPAPVSAVPETVHCFLLLVQELASLSVHVPFAQMADPSLFSAAAAVPEEFAGEETPWLLQFVAGEHQKLTQVPQKTATCAADGTSPSSRRLDQLMSYCLMLPPALLWGGDTTEAEPTRGLDAVWNFIEQALLQSSHRCTLRGSHWSGAMATHVCRGLFHHCHSGGVIKTVRQWLHSRPRLMAALLTPHWRLVLSAAEVMLGKNCKEALLGSWETALYAAEGALTPCPPHPDETSGVFLSSVAEDPVGAAVALHAICLRLPTQDGETESVADLSVGRILDADITVGIVKQLFADEAALPCFRAAMGESDKSVEDDSRSPMYELQHDLAPVQRAAVTFVQLLAARCATLPPIQPEKLGSLAYTAPFDLEAWLGALCWRLLVCLVETMPWLLLAVGGEPSLCDPSGTQVFPSTAFVPGVSIQATRKAMVQQVHAAGTEGVFLTLAEWLSLGELCNVPSDTGSTKVAPGAVALALCGSRLSAHLKCSSQQAQARGAGIDGGDVVIGCTRNQRLVAVVNKLAGALSAQSLRNFPPRAVGQLVAAVPHLAALLRPN